MNVLNPNSYNCVYEGNSIGCDMVPVIPGRKVVESLGTPKSLMIVNCIIQTTTDIVSEVETADK